MIEKSVARALRPVVSEDNHMPKSKAWRGVGVEGSHVVERTKTRVSRYHRGVAKLSGG